MDQANPQQTNQNGGAKSFKFYKGEKAPLLVQIIGGLLWLGAAGAFLSSISGVLLMKIDGLILLALGIFAVIAGRSLFRMKRSAMRNVIIFAAVVFAAVSYDIIRTGFIGGFNGNKNEIMAVLTAILFVLVVYKYKEKFVN